MSDKIPSILNSFRFTDDINVTREGKTVKVRGRDNAFITSESVESNLLLEILRELRKRK